MDNGLTQRIFRSLLLLSILSFEGFALPHTGAAAIKAPVSTEARPSARRTAARAIQRRSSTQWIPDVAERIRILETQAERATYPQTGPHGTGRATPPREGGALP